VLQPGEYERAMYTKFFFLFLKLSPRQGYLRAQLRPGTSLVFLEHFFAKKCSGS